MELVFDLENIQIAAADFLRHFPADRVFAIEGEMGAGKTTFIAAVCKNLGVTDSIGSPTYSIINEYNYPEGRIYHLDLYRLKDEEEIINAGVMEAVDSGEYCFIEWPQKAADLLSEETQYIKLVLEADQQRKLIL